MRRAIPLVTACLLILAAADPLLAQQRLFALTSGPDGYLVELDTSPSSLGRVLRRTRLPPGSLWNPVPAAGGMALVWPSYTDGVAVFDTRTGSVRNHTVPGFVAEHVLGTDASSFQLVVLGSTGSPGAVTKTILIADLRQGTTRLMDLGSVRNVGAVAYSARSHVLFVARPRVVRPLQSASYFDVDVISADSGTTLKSLDVSPADAQDLATTTDGTRLFVDSVAGGIFAFDVGSGALVASRAQSQPWGVPIVDEGRRRLLLARRGSTEATLEALSIDTLQLLGRAELPRLTVSPVTHTYAPFVELNADVSAQSATIYAFETVATTFNYFGTVCDQSKLVAIDVDTGRLRRAVDASSLTDCFLDLVRLTEPGTPTGPTVNVTGSRVTLSWGAEAATHYELEAGTGPGLANLGTVTVNGTQLTVDDVPPGAYHVRLRAVNTIGKSAASQEVRVVVP